MPQRMHIILIEADIYIIKYIGKCPASRVECDTPSPVVGNAELWPSRMYKK